MKFPGRLYLTLRKINFVKNVGCNSKKLNRYIDAKNNFQSFKIEIGYFKNIIYTHTWEEHQSSI